MLKKFAVTNFRGFDKRIEFDLSRPGNYAFNQFAISDGVVKNGIIYGPNGCGKTNLGLALFDIEYHLAPLKAKKSDYYDNFVYAGNPQGLVDFEYWFVFGEMNVEYRYSKNSSGMLRKEVLLVNGERVFAYDDENSVIINPAFFPNGDSIQAEFSSNANGVSLINFLLMFYPVEKEHFLMRLQSFVNGMLWFKGLDVREFIGIESKPNGNIEEYIIANGLVGDFADFLFRLSGQRFDFVTPNEGDAILWYRVQGNKLPFCPSVSTGTRSLELLYFWMKHMQETSFVFIDEFDAFYHFRLAFNVSKELFGMACQLFLSSHNTYLMINELLRPDCNFILNGGEVKPMNECTDKELRFGHNIEKLFRGKAFGV
ncbi:MAG: ATP-binding protein [Muribaculaceae bacterium]|nr:ATP-binding protein [Muribaculaceae bacterium]